MPNTKPLNEKQPGDHGYVAFYNSTRYEVYGLSLIAARDIVQSHVQKLYPRRKIKGYHINIMVAETPDGSAVVHSGAD